MPKLKVGKEKEAAVKIHYEDYGKGKPVVLIHGWPLSGRAWEKQVFPLVEAGYRVITYDRRGFGKSTQPWKGYDYDTLASDLHQLIKKLDLKDVTVVGFSMGGGEVARYIANYGTKRLSKAVLASAVPPYLYKTDDNPDGALDDAAIEEFENGVKSDRLAFLEHFGQQFFRAGDRTDLISEEFRHYMRDIASFASPKGTLACIDAFSRTDFRPDLKKFDIPTLVIHGDADGIVPIEASGKRAAEAIADSRYEVIEGGPHGINATHAEQFNKILIDFLNS